MFYIVLLFALALMRDHPLVAPVADVIIPNIHHIIHLIEVMDRVPIFLIDPSLPSVDIAPVTIQWGPQSTWLDHLAFLDEARMVSALSTSPVTIPPAQSDFSVSTQCRWLDQLAYLAEAYENQNSAQALSQASVAQCVWLDQLSFLDQCTTPPATTVSPSKMSSSFPSFVWLDHLASLNIYSIDATPVVSTQSSITTLVRALFSAVIILAALLELHDLNHRRKTNIWLAPMATLVYYAIMLFDVPEQVVFLAARFVFPLACSTASWLWRTVLLVPTEVPLHKYDALDRSHQELMAAFGTLLIVNYVSYTAYCDEVSAKTISIGKLQDNLAHETDRTARLTTEKDVAQADVKTLTDDKTHLATAVQGLNDHVIGLAQELHAASVRNTEIEEDLSIANELTESQAGIVTERNNENDILTARILTVQQDFSDRLATESATIERLTEEARLAALTHETLVNQNTAAMDQNAALEGQLNSTIQEKAATDMEHTVQVQALTAEVQTLRASLSTADQRIQGLVLRTTAQAVEVSTSRRTMTSLRASLAACQRPTPDSPSPFPFGGPQATHVAPAAIPKPLDGVLQANVMMQGRIKEENRQMQQKIRSLTSEVSGLRMALARRPAFSFPPVPAPTRLDAAAEPKAQPSRLAVPSNLPSLYEAQRRRRRTLSFTNQTIQSTPTTEEPIDSSRSAHPRDETSHGLGHRRVQTTPVFWSVNSQLEICPRLVRDGRYGGSPPPRVYKVRLPQSSSLATQTSTMTQRPATNIQAIAELPSQHMGDLFQRVSARKQSSPLAVPASLTPGKVAIVCRLPRPRHAPQPPSVGRF